MTFMTYLKRCVRGRWISIDVAGFPDVQGDIDGEWQTLVLKVLSVHSGFVEYVDRGNVVGVLGLDALASFSFLPASQARACDDELQQRQLEDRCEAMVHSQLAQTEKELEKASPQRQTTLSSS